MSEEKVEGLGRGALLSRLTLAEGQVAALMRPMVYIAAHVAHEANRAYCIHMGDTSQVCWSDAPQWQKDSAIAGVVKLVENPKSTPKEMHESWMSLKLSEGWTYGEVKDAEAKTHPCMVPYEELSKVQQFKDALFSAVVRSALGI